VSPVNSDDSSGDPFADAGRTLTRKEIRAREKAITSESGDAVPEQAYESGEELHVGVGAAQRTVSSASACGFRFGHPPDGGNSHTPGCRSCCIRCPGSPHS
jgi:UPF0755 protein